MSPFSAVLGKIVHPRPRPSATGDAATSMIVLATAIIQVLFPPLAPVPTILRIRRLLVSSLWPENYRTVRPHASPVPRVKRADNGGTRVVSMKSRERPRTLRRRTSQKGDILLFRDLKKGTFYFNAYPFRSEAHNMS